MLKKIAHKLGIDRAIFYTSAARLFQGAAGVVSVLLVASLLSGVEQGFYYTFASILAVQLFFELGLGGIITQFVAHERAHLEEQDGVFSGNAKHLSRLAYLLHFCIKWYALLAVGLVVVITTVGFVFFYEFYDSAEPVRWQLPWMLLVLVTAVNFIISPISAYIEGLGKVAEIAKVRFVQQLVSPVLLWGGLFVGLRLFVVVLAPLATAVIFFAMGGGLFGPMLKNLYRIHIEDKVNYRTEILPYQWRIALSWVSGYFIFQLFNPVLFATEGAAIAGQMGMTLSILNSIQALALSWITTKVPVMSSYIAMGAYVDLDLLFNRTVKQMMSLVVSTLVLMFVAVFGIDHFHITLFGVAISTRLLPLLPMGLMMVALLANQYISSVATYLRCHKKEPFLVNSVVGGVLCALSTVLLGKYYGVMGITAGYCAITVLILLPWAYHIYVAKKRAWHRF